MSADFFDALFDAQTPNPVRVRLDAAEKRRRARIQAEKEVEDEKVLTKAYRRWKRAKRDALLAGPHGREVRGIVSFLDTMSLSSAPALIGTIERAHWVKALSADDRHTLLGIVGAGIARCREKAGLDPYDDGVPGDPPKAFERIKTFMEIR